MVPGCLFCNSERIEVFKLPKNSFNAKEFSYLKCTQCKLVFLNPIPAQDDLQKMYPPSYQQGVSKNITNAEEKMPGLRFPYAIHFEFLKKNNICKNIIDFGCGNGHFIYNALQHGITVNGVEFSPEQVENLKKEIKEVSFFTVQEFHEKETAYDAIFMSNVLEHFTNPNEQFSMLLKKLNKGGIILIEGPLEMNKSLVNTFKWFYFKLRLFLNKKYQTNHVPTHIFFSSYHNQLNFFEKHQLNTEYYKIAENAWPYPEKYSDIKNPGDVIKYLIGKTSSFVSLFIPNFGNTFIYVGKKTSLSN